jgi:hypothetical protein
MILGKSYFFQKVMFWYQTTLYEILSILRIFSPFLLKADYCVRFGNFVRNANKQKIGAPPEFNYSKFKKNCKDPLPPPLALLSTYLVAFLVDRAEVTKGTA